jgi:hypothetical protein
MKSNILYTIILIFTTTYCFGQFSISNGLTIPVGSFANVEEGAANPGYQIALSYDYKLNPKYGISTGILLGINTLKDNSENLFNERILNSSFTPVSPWSYALIEVGAYVRLTDNLKFKGLITGGHFATPVYDFISETITFNGGTITGGGSSTSTTFGIGLDLKVEYSIGKFYIGSSFLYANPEFEIIDRNPNRQVFSNIAFNVGYKF